MRVLVTGANGFIGRGIVERLAKEPEVEVIGAQRTDNPLPAGVQRVQAGDLAADGPWSEASRDVDVVIHTAGRAHVLRETAADPLAAFRRDNVTATLQLARGAAISGVRRFIFLSSIAVHGPQGNRPIKADDPPAPNTPYGVSKLEAERGLWEISEASGLEVVAIRPPLVYGPGAPGNFRTLMRWLDRGIPLPFGSINSRRSLVGLGNLVELVVACIKHPDAPGEAFLVSDGEDISTTALLRKVARAMNRPTRLFPFPPKLLKVAAATVGKARMAQQLCESLQLDIAKTKETLDWKPSFSLEEGLHQTAVAFRASSKTTK